ncbi:neprilysin-1-like [Dermacentor variabilis]|uniref:neprilysin-1-like n=1 Tax=Dermacentor variabilis TaxID=34621 RepID=UPI003F5BF3EC
MAIGRLGAYTDPYVTADQWGNFFSKYTNNTYRAVDSIVLQIHVVNMLANLLNDTSVGQDGLRHLVAWSVYTQLMEYTVPELLVGRRKSKDVCYEHVGKAMKLAVVSPYLQWVKPFMLDQVKAMLGNIRNGFRDAFKFSTWVKEEVRETALRKLAKMKAYVGSPGQRLDAAFVEELYRPFPDVPQDSLFPTWIKAVSLSAHYLWTDQKTRLYDEAAVNAFYQVLFNTIVIPTAIIQRPLHYFEGPVALSYGGLGTVVGHEIMHAYDVKGTEIDDNGINQPWVTPEFTKEYTQRALCLRQSHKEAIRLMSRQQVVNDTLDSENIADLVGVKVAYDAFTLLPYRERIMTLVGLNISANRLFFISHCIKWCAQHRQLTSRYAPYRSRCIVPLMNMPEFSNAFGCVAGQPMNPKKKCDFWS